MWEKFRNLKTGWQVAIWVIFPVVPLFAWAASKAPEQRKKFLGIATGVTLVWVIILAAAMSTTPPDDVTAITRPTLQQQVDPTPTPTATATPEASPTKTATQQATPKPTATATKATTTTTTKASSPKPKATATKTTSTSQGTVHPGSYCSPVGATGTSSGGVPMTCSEKSCDGKTYDRPRWRKTTC